MTNILKAPLLFILLLITTDIFAAPNADHALFKNLYDKWTTAFNHKDLKQSCDLFSKNLTADYRGFPTKNYQTVCEGFKKIFQDPSKQYHYTFKIKQVYRSGNLAAVRVTWHLTVHKHNKLISSTTDEGLDVLEKNKLGQWKIINYLGYPVQITNNNK